MKRTRPEGEEAAASVVVDGRRIIGTVNPSLFGQNLEPATCRKLVWPGGRLSTSEGLRGDVLEVICNRAPVPIVRWPGGNFASQYHWRDGIGPRTVRPVTYDLAWRAKESNYFGTDEFIDFCRRIEAVPYITVNAGSGTIEEAAGWVEYCNLEEEPIETAGASAIVPWRLPTERGLPRTRNAGLRGDEVAPYDVRYWSVGNETWGDFQTGNLTSSENARRAAEYAKSMKQVDPRIRVTGVGMYLSNVWRFFESQPHTNSLDWNLELLRGAGEWIDAISLHRYFFREVGDAFSGLPFERPMYLPLLACPIYSERKLRAVMATIDAVGELLQRSTPTTISFDEWDFGSRTLAHGLATARFFNVLVRLSRAVTIACGEQWVADVKPEGLLLEASHVAIEMYQRLAGTTALDAQVDCESYDTEIEEYRGASHHSSPEPFRGVPYLDAAAARSADRGKLYLSLINCYEEKALRCAVELRDLDVSPSGTAHELNAPDALSENSEAVRREVAVTSRTADGVGRRFSYLLPAHSATILELDLRPS